MDQNSKQFQPKNIVLKCHYTDIGTESEKRYHLDVNASNNKNGPGRYKPFILPYLSQNLACKCKFGGMFQVFLSQQLNKRQ